MRALPMILIAVTASIATAGCTPTGSSSSPTTSDPAGIPEVTAPPVRLTPFCQAMLDLDEALPADPAVDTTEQVLEAYRAALRVVPAEIEPEFRAVIVALESGTRATVPDDGDGAGGDPETGAVADVGDAGDAAAPSPDLVVPHEAASGPTTLPSDEQLFAEEGWLPDNDPAARVNAYIDFACRGTANNPGPPATAPDAAPPTSAVE